MQMAARRVRCAKLDGSHARGGASHGHVETSRPRLSAHARVQAMSYTGGGEREAGNRRLGGRL